MLRRPCLVPKLHPPLLSLSSGVISRFLQPGWKGRERLLHGVMACWAAGRRAPRLAYHCRRRDMQPCPAPSPIAADVELCAVAQQLPKRALAHHTHQRLGLTGKGAGPASLPACWHGCIGCRLASPCTHLQCCTGSPWIVTSAQPMPPPPPPHAASPLRHPHRPCPCPPPGQTPPLQAAREGRDPHWH